MSSDMIAISRVELEVLKARIVDLSDIVAAYEAMSGAALPAKYAMQIIEDNKHPVKVWRDYRGMKQSDLSKASGVSAAYISDIETGKNQGSVEAFRAIAEALNTTMDALTV